MLHSTRLTGTATRVLESHPVRVSHSNCADGVLPGSYLVLAFDADGERVPRLWTESEAKGRDGSELPVLEGTREELFISLARGGPGDKDLHLTPIDGGIGYLAITPVGHRDDADIQKARRFLIPGVQIIPRDIDGNGPVKVRLRGLPLGEWDVVQCGTLECREPLSLGTITVAPNS